MTERSGDIFKDCPFHVDVEWYWHGGTQEEIVSAVKTHNENTHRLYPYIHDFPDEHRTFAERWQRGREWVFRLGWTHSKYVQISDCVQVLEPKDIERAYHEAVGQLHYEGLILRRSNATSTDGPSWDIRKLKPTLDCEARVIGYERGKPAHKYADTLGALIVRLVNGPNAGKVCKVSGMTDAQRDDFFRFPPIGKIITIEFNNYSKYGIPVSPRFVGFRDDSVQ